MKNNLRIQWAYLLPVVVACWAFGHPVGTLAQTFPTPTGFTLPNGKSICITYEVDVIAGVCPAGTLAPANISNQATVSGTNFAPVSTDDPDIIGAANPTLTPVASLMLGNLIFNDLNRNGVFDGGDAGINGVAVNLYKDDGDNVLDAGDVLVTTTTTAGGGLYLFTPLCPGDYIVEVAASNFAGALTGLVSSPVPSSTDPDDNINNDDNGDEVPSFGVASKPVTLAIATEPTTDGDADNSTNLSVDFGFKTKTTISIGDVTMNEGSGGATTSFTFTLTRSSNEDLIGLTVNTMNGTAVSANDFTVVSGGTVNFAAAGLTTATVTVLVNHDFLVEANETFTVLLSGAPNYATLTDDTGLGTITNDEVDLGDAPDTYATLLASAGASHMTTLGFQLGSSIDGDGDGQPGASADGDDVDTEGDDDDGVTLPAMLEGGTTANVTVNASMAGKLDAWVDFNNNGSFAEAGEKVFDNVALVAGNNNLSFAVPSTVTTGSTFTRFRFSSAGALTFNGAAANGEVEDYVISTLALPLDLLSFTGQVTGRSNRLAWETVTEKNVSAHIVERSAEGTYWAEVGRRNGQLHSLTPTKYTLEDIQPLALAYYRLRSVDVDGQQSISRVILLDREAEKFGLRSVFPNPATEQLTVQFMALAEESVRLEMFDVAGKLVGHQTVAARPGLNTALLPVRHLPAGVYSLVLSNDRVVAAPLRVVKE